MRQLVVFNHVSLDGYFVDVRGEMRWAHKDDAEWNAFVAGNTSRRDGTLLFGRITYDMMASFWPTPLAMQQAPAVAKHMNETTKVVFSRTLTQPSWENTRILGGDLASDVTRLKGEAGGDIVVLGSGKLVSAWPRRGW